jgi:hypothetical protein
LEPKKKGKIGSTNEAGDIVKHSVQKEVVMAHNTSHDIFTSLLLSSALMID